MEHVFTLQRLDFNDKSTIGVLLDNNKQFTSFAVEDTYREEKIKSVTRIPAGKYEIKQREVLSGKTKQYRSRYDWFEWHLELQDVPNFEYVYIHIGNTASDSDGCILLGESALPQGDQWFTGNSTKTFKEFYLKVIELLEEGDKVFINILDEGAL